MFSFTAALPFGVRRLKKKKLWI